MRKKIYGWLSFEAQWKILILLNIKFPLLALIAYNIYTALSSNDNQTATSIFCKKKVILKILDLLLYHIHSSI